MKQVVILEINREKIMKEAMNRFIDRLNFGQAYLLLGQNYLADAITKDYYKSVSNYLNITNTNADIYLELEEKSENVENILQWMQTEADYITLPEWGKYLAKVKWNGIITSSVEYFVEKMLRLEMRDVRPIYQFKKNLPYDFKSKQKLHISYLYGCLNQIDKGLRPPCSIFDFSTYSSNASILLNQIDREFLTPLGMLVIDGYDYSNDWLKEETLFAICHKLTKEQVYFFGFKKEYLKSKYIKKLVDEGIIIPISKSLISILKEAESEGLLNEYTGDLKTDDLVISIDNKRRVLPKKINEIVSRTCQVLDDFTFDFDDVSSEEEKDLFREFLYKSSIEPVWRAFYHGMNIVRTYEDEAFNIIIETLNRDTIFKKPIVLYGQSGTGKSVAMASLAYRIKVLKKYPVLYIDGENIDVHNTDIEEFCSWCDDINVAVFWDASTHGNGVGKYLELNDYLASKGKKAVIIGTSYNIDRDIRHKYIAKYIEAPVIIDSEKEINNFKENYEKYTNKKLDEVWTQKYDNNFLVALYRLLPNTNYNIRKGLLSEISVDMIELSEVVTLKEKNTPMMQLLQKSGIPVSSYEEKKESNKISIGKIIKMVSVIGQYGMAIPFDIMFRMLSGEISYLVGILLEKIDFLHVEMDMNGTISVFPRNSLEAKIVANSSMVQLSERVDLIKEIIGNVSEKELGFLVSLLKAIGPNGATDNNDFKEYYKDIAESVKELRLSDGVYNEGTILQEASYIREYFKESETKAQDVEALIKTQELLLEEIKYLEGKKDEFYYRNSYGQFLIELSSNIGAELLYFCELKGNVNKILDIYKKLDYYLELATIYSPDPYYPVDIWAWSINNVLKTGISEDKKIELVGKLVSVFEKILMENPEIVNREDYNSRIIKVDTFEREENITEQAFCRLIEMGSDSGIYLKARKLIYGLDLMQRINEEDIIKIDKAIEYLETDEFKQIVYGSKKCLFLLFRLYWLKSVKEPTFFVEKKILLLAKNEWENLYLLLLRIEELSEEVSIHIKYLIGICEFHLGKEDDSIRRFEEIRNDYRVGPRRPILYYIASSVDGQKGARNFQGQLKKIEKEKGRAKFYIPAIRRNIFYYNYEFVTKDIEENMEYDRIHIGFSFMGIRISDIQ